MNGMNRMFRPFRAGRFVRCGFPRALPLGWYDGAPLGLGKGRSLGGAEANSGTWLRRAPLDS